MKKTITKLVAVLLAAVHILALCACGGSVSSSTPAKTDTPTLPEDETPKFNIYDYSVIYSNQLNTKATEAAEELALLMTGSEFNAKIDKVTDPTELEILIGETNRPESAEALALAKDGGFVWCGSFLGAIGDEKIIKKNQIVKKAVEEIGGSFYKH